MFKRIASEALGLSDIGSIIPPKDYDKVEADDYVFHEDGEKIFFLIKSKQDEYCFTNRALIHVDGDSALSKKRMLRRYEYYKYPIANVYLETAGTMDLDVEIKFTIGDASFSIDVDKRQIGQLADLYKALFAMSLMAEDNRSRLAVSMDVLDKAISVVAAGRTEGMDKVTELARVKELVQGWVAESREKYLIKDFADVFLKYINN